MHQIGWKGRLSEQWERWVSVRVPDEEVARVGRLFNTLMVMSIGLTTAITLVMVGILISGISPAPRAVAGVLFPATFTVLAWFCLIQARRGHVRPMASLYVWSNFASIAVAAFLFGGPRSPAFLLYLWTIGVAGIALSPAYALGVTGWALGYFLLLLLLQWAGFYQSPLVLGTAAREIGFVTFTIIIMGATGVLIYLNTRSQQEALVRLRATTRELEEYRRTLEEQVAARTADLARRTAQLEAASHVARRAAEFRDVDMLLNETVRLISDHFGFYHVGIFLLDERGEYAVLQAASSEGGRRMLDRGYRLAVREISVVGTVAATGQPRIALDVGADAVFFDNPDLPLTRSEMALPLKVGERVIGVLDIQSEEPEAFTQEDVAILQTMADQITLAVENARALAQMQRTLRELERATGEYTREAWRTVHRARRWVGRRYRRLVAEPTEEPTEEARQALLEGRSVIQPLHEEGDGRVVGTRLAVPMKLRGQVIGVLNLRFTAPEVPPETVQMVEAIADRLVLALETVRLLEESRRRVERERLTSDISQKLTTYVQMDRILQVAAEEVSQALGGAEVLVQILPETQPAATEQAG